MVGRFERAFPSPAPVSLPPNQWGGKITVLRFIRASAALSDWKCQGAEWYTSCDERKVQKIFTSSYEMQLPPQQNWAAPNRTQHHHPRDLRPTVLQSNFVSPILGIKGEHKKSYATNHYILSVSATYLGLAWGESLSLFLSLFKMGAKLVTYHKGVFS